MSTYCWSAPNLKKTTANAMNTFRNPDIGNSMSLTKLIWKWKEDGINDEICGEIIGYK